MCVLASLSGVISHKIGSSAMGSRRAVALTTNPLSIGEGAFIILCSAQNAQRFGQNQEADGWVVAPGRFGRTRGGSVLGPLASDCTCVSSGGCRGRYHRTLTSPTRRVTFRSSRCSRNGIAYLRVVPKRSRMAATFILALGVDSVENALAHPVVSRRSVVDVVVDLHQLAASSRAFST